MTGYAIANDAALEEQFYAWWRRLALTGGVVSVAIGLILMIWPRATLAVVAILIGLWLVIGGLVQLAQAAFMPEGRGTGSRVLMAIAGLVGVVLGVLCMRNLTDSLLLIAALIGVSLLFGAIAQLSPRDLTAHPQPAPALRAAARPDQPRRGPGDPVLAEPTLHVVVWLTGIWRVPPARSGRAPTGLADAGVRLARKLTDRAFCPVIPSLRRSAVFTGAFTRGRFTVHLPRLTSWSAGQFAGSGAVGRPRTAGL